MAPTSKSHPKAEERRTNRRSDVHELVQNEPLPAFEYRPNHPRQYSPVRGDGWSMRVDALGRVRIDFFGPTSTDALRKSTAKLSDVIFARGPSVLIVDLRKLVGHNNESREIWRRWLTLHKRDLVQVVVVMPQTKIAPLLKMVATALGLAVGLRLLLTDTVP